MRLVAIAFLVVAANAAAEGYNRTIVDKVFSGKSEQEKRLLEKQIKEKSEIQYGNGTLQSNPSPLKDADVLNNIKSFHPIDYKKPPY